MRAGSPVRRDVLWSTKTDCGPGSNQPAACNLLDRRLPEGRRRQYEQIFPALVRAHSAHRHKGSAEMPGIGRDGGECLGRRAEQDRVRILPTCPPPTPMPSSRPKRLRPCAHHSPEKRGISLSILLLSRKLGAFGLRSEAGCAKPRLPWLESSLSFCTGCGSKAANSSGHQRRLLISLHSRTTEFPPISGN